MLTGGNISDVKAASALLERAGRMRSLWPLDGIEPKLSAKDAVDVPLAEVKAFA